MLFSNVLLIPVDIMPGRPNCCGSGMVAVNERGQATGFGVCVSGLREQGGVMERGVFVGVAAIG